MCCPFTNVYCYIIVVVRSRTSTVMLQQLLKCMSPTECFQNCHVCENIFIYLHFVFKYCFINYHFLKCSLSKFFTLSCSSLHVMILFFPGEIGDWKNWFTVSQNEQFDAMYKKEMKGVEVDFIYETQQILYRYCL